MGCMTTGRWVLGAVLALGCQAESPVVGESSADADPVSDYPEFTATASYVLERIAGDTCIPYDLVIDEATSATPCVVIETELEQSEECNCSPERARGIVSVDVVEEIRQELKNSGDCDAGAGSPACEDLCQCEILQASGAAADACQTELEPPESFGYCIVDPEQDQGNTELLSDCPPSRDKLLRFDASVPAPNTALHLACVTRAWGPQEVMGLGEACTPSIEGDPSFSGFTEGSVSLETRAPGCESNLCLVHNFQGRVSCPYGQSQEEAETAPRCFLPGSEVPIQIEVAPQLLARPADQSSICSCKCDGPNPDPLEPYCECPEAMECVPLIHDLGLGAIDGGGSYCVPRGSWVSDTGRGGPVCDASKENCGSAL